MMSNALFFLCRTLQHIGPDFVFGCKKTFSLNAAHICLKYTKEECFLSFLHYFSYFHVLLVLKWSLVAVEGEHVYQIRFLFGFMFELAEYFQICRNSPVHIASSRY